MEMAGDVPPQTPLFYFVQVFGGVCGLKEIDPRLLKPHSLNSWLYKEREDSDFLESVRRFGILEPLVVNRDGVILSGHRRWKAALKLGFKSVPCVVEEFENEKVAIVELNRQRVKTPREIYREYLILKQELVTIANERPLAPLKPFKDSFVKFDKTEAEERVHVREQAAEKLGVSSGRLYMIEKIYENEDKIPDIVAKLDRGEITVHKAYKALKRPEKPTPPKAWKCPVCQNEYVVEKPVALKICPYCEMDFVVWKAERSVGGEKGC